MDFLEQRKGYQNQGAREQGHSHGKAGPIRRRAGGPPKPADMPDPTIRQPTRPGTTRPTRAHRQPPRREAHGFAISFIRTVTVGSGIAPDLLTLQGTKKARQALAGSCKPFRPQIPPVGNFAPP